MARTKHFSNQPSSHPRKRLHFDRSPAQQHAVAEANAPATPSRAARTSPRTTPGELDESAAPQGAPSQSQQQQPPPRRRRFRPRVVALREVWRLQKTWKLLIPLLHSLVL